MALKRWVTSLAPLLTASSPYTRMSSVLQERKKKKTKEDFFQRVYTKVSNLLDRKSHPNICKKMIGHVCYIFIIEKKLCTCLKVKTNKICLYKYAFLSLVLLFQKHLRSTLKGQSYDIFDSFLGKKVIHKMFFIFKKCFSLGGEGKWVINEKWSTCLHNPHQLNNAGFLKRRSMRSWGSSAMVWPTETVIPSFTQPSTTCIITTI